MPFVIPVGINFADGVTALPVQPAGSVGTPLIIGTPLPTSEIYIYANNTVGGLIQEEPGSPEIERAEQCTCKHDLRMPYSQGLSYWSVMGRGTIVTDTAANVWRILSCNIKRTEGTFCTFSYVAESISFDSPPDDFEINEVSLDLNIIKHPRYAWALSPYVSDSSTYSLVGDTPIYYTEIKEAIIRMIQNYTDSPFYPSQAQVQGLIQSNILSTLNLTNGQTSGTIQLNYPNSNYNGGKTTVAPVPWNGLNSSRPTVNCQFFLLAVPFNLADPYNPISIALAAAKELISKLWRQEDTPYIAGYEITWTQYFFAPVYLNPGGYVEDPRYIVPQYFMSPYNNGVIPRGYQNNPFGGDSSLPVPVGGTTIFDLLPYINPQCYSSNGQYGGNLSFSCLRKSDSYGYQRTWFAVHHKWMCAPVGKWDADLYNQNDRPNNANGYNQLPGSFS